MSSQVLNELFLTHCFDPTWSSSGVYTKRTDGGRNNNSVGFCHFFVTHDYYVVLYKKILIVEDVLHYLTMLCGDLFSDACLSQSRVAQS